MQKIKPGERTIWGCGAPLGNTPVLDVDGGIYACIYLVGLSRYKLGAIQSKAPYPDPGVVSMMKNVIDIDNEPGCRECRLRYVCGGGCPVGRFMMRWNARADEEVRAYTREIACRVNTGMIEESLWHLAAEAHLGAASSGS